MTMWQATRHGYARMRGAAIRHVAAPNRLTTLSNTGATIIWTHLPIYPLLVWWLVGRPIWPSAVILVTEPFFFCIPFVSRRHPTVSTLR